MNSMRFVEHNTITDRDMITLECYKPLDIPWRCKTTSSTSARDARSVFWLLRASGSFGATACDFMNVRPTVISRLIGQKENDS